MRNRATRDQADTLQTNEDETMSVLWLTLAIMLEVSGTTCMKVSEGLTRITPTLTMSALYGLSLAALSLALKKIDVGVAYAVWSGLGTALITIVGVAVFRESLTTMKVAAIGVIITGVVLLNLYGGAH